MHAKNNSFGYEEVAYLLLFGKLPTTAGAEPVSNGSQSDERCCRGASIEDVIIESAQRQRDEHALKERCCFGAVCL